MKYIVAILLFSSIIVTVKGQPPNLNGFWKADDGGSYYVRQDGIDLWWAGFSDDRGLQNGILFCNVFHGTISGNVIKGEWADVPRGTTNDFGSMSLIIEFHANTFTLRKQDATGGFSASTWDKIVFMPASLTHLKKLFEDITKNVPTPFGHEVLDERDNNLHIIKEQPVVVYGTLQYPKPPESNELVTYNYPLQNLTTWDDFWKYDDELDGDITFHIDGVETPNDFISGMTNDDQREVESKIAKGIHCELVMFARNGKNKPTLLPGWAEKDGNSILINGAPINGNVTLKPGMGVTSFSGVPINITNSIRVTGALVFDRGHSDNFEIHPVYNLDVINTKDTSVLSGVWGDDQNNTYYVHQIGSKVWCLITRPFRDETFSAVFQGDVMSTGKIVKGKYIRIPFTPLTNSNEKGDMFFTIEPNRTNILLTGDVSFAPSHLSKLYDAQGQ